MSAAAARAWLVAAGVWLGVASSSAVHPGGWVLVVLAGACLAGTRRTHGMGLLGLALVCLAASGLAAGARSTRPSAVEELAVSVPSCRVEGRVVEQAGGLGTLVFLDRASCEGFAPAHDAGVVALQDPFGYAGDRFSAAGWLVPLGDRSFDEARRDLGAGALFEPSDLERAGPGRGPHRLAAAYRRALERSTSELDPSVGGLVRGLTVGDTSDLDGATLDRARRSGLAHLLAVSGSNVVLVLGAILYLVRRGPLVLRTVVAGAGLVMFVIVVGPDASVLRAGAMGAIGLVALAGGVRPDPLASLGLAAAIVVGVRPAMAGSVGLHLSVAATAGIVLWAGRIAALLPGLPRLASLTLGATLAAQAAVSPVLIVAFGQLSLVAPLANLLAAPAVPPATILGLASGLAGLVHGGAGELLARLAWPFGAWVLEVSDTLGAPAWAAVEPPRWTAWAAAVLLGCSAALTLMRAPGREGGGL